MQINLPWPTLTPGSSQIVSMAYDPSVNKIYVNNQSYNNIWYGMNMKLNTSPQEPVNTGVIGPKYLFIGGGGNSQLSSLTFTLIERPTNLPLPASNINLF